MSTARRRSIVDACRRYRTQDSASTARSWRKTKISEIRKADQPDRDGGDIRPFILVAASTAFLDQFSKALAIIFLVPLKAYPIWSDYLKLTLIRNRGAAFGISLGRYSDVLLLFISIAAIILIIIYYARSSPSQRWQHLTFGLITGGAVGNLIDRLAKQEVVDFIDCGIGTLRWPIFNVADIAITIGAIFLIKHSFVYQPRKTRDVHHS